MARSSMLNSTYMSSSKPPEEVRNGRAGQTVVAAALVIRHMNIHRQKQGPTFVDTIFISDFFLNHYINPTATPQLLIQPSRDQSTPQAAAISFVQPAAAFANSFSPSVLLLPHAPRGLFRGNPATTTTFKPNPQSRFIADEMESFQERMLKEFAEIRAAQSKLANVDGLSAQLAALDAKLTEQAARLNQVQVKVDLSCNTLGQVQQSQAHAAQMKKQQEVPEASSPTTSEISDGILGARPPPVGRPPPHPLQIPEVASVHLQPVLPVVEENTSKRQWMPKMDFPKFDGTDVRIWLDKCDAFFRLYHIPESFKMPSLPVDDGETAAAEEDGHGGEGAASIRMRGAAAAPLFFLSSGRRPRLGASPSYSRAVQRLLCDNFAVWSCVQTALKAANSVVGLAGMDVILYALWVLRAWSKQHSVVGLAQLLTAGFAVLPPIFLLPLRITPTEFAAKSVARLADAPTADRIPTVLPG
uniref:Uncharacterized protein n=1 Tax=Aegilops tauschii TaxID=37682 RepID=M8C5Q8_AEGTA